MLEVLFGGKTKERVLQYLLAKEEGYIRGISNYYDVSASVVKLQIDKLEQGSVIIGKNAGNTRMYRLNPRYPFLKELIALLERARESYSPDELQRLMSSDRTRPRRKGKPLWGK
ncbi:MAG: ArsR family transcriptional regulator [Epsilonproteobacteria bacterium]|nr:MAG: ArsR family transcriptional regulator [Campylobacterota bacterium]